MNKYLSLVSIFVFSLAFILSGCSIAPAATATQESVPSEDATVPSTETELATEPAINHATDTPAATDQTSVNTPDAEALAAGEKLVQDRCSVCHSLARIESKKASHDQWEQTVTRMIANGAQLNDEEKQLVIDYLAATYPE